MKKLFRHFFQTALLVACAWLVMMIPGDTWGSYINPSVWGLIVLILIAMGIYLYRGHKKGLFMLALLTCLSTPALAYQKVTCTNETSVTINSDAESCSGEGCEYHKCMVDAYKDKADYCSLKSEFDVDEAVKEESKKPKDEDIKNAVRYLDAYDRAAAAGCVEKHGAFVDYLTLGIISGDDEDNRDCANKYLEKVAEYKKKKTELNTQTVYQILKNDENSCWPCGLINVMITAVEKLSLSMEDELSKAALMLLGVMFLFWLLIKVLMLIGQFGTANNAEFFTDLLTRFILAVIAVALLSGPMGFVYRVTFSSLLDVTLNLSTQVVAQADSESNVIGEGSDYLSKVNDYHGFGSKLVNNEYLACKCCTDENSTCNVDDKGQDEKISECKIDYDSTKVSYEGTGFTDDEVRMLFTKKDKQAILCLTCKTYKETAPFVAAGRVLVYHSWENKKILSKIAGWVEDLVGVHAVSYVPNPISMWFVGMALIICFSWIAYVIAFKLLDIFLRIGFVIILTPFLITTFVFPISRQYTKRGWDFLAHAILSMFAISIGIALFMAAFKASLPTNMLNSLKEVFTVPDIDLDSTGRQQYAEKLMTAVSGGEDGSAFYAFLIILLLCFCAINVLQASQVIVEGLSGLTCGIPSIAGAAVVGAIRAALAPIRMIKNIVMDKLDGGGFNAWKRAKKDDEKSQEQNANDDQPGVFTALGGFTGNQVRKAGDKVGNAAGKGAEASVKYTGKAVEAGGKGLSSLGKGVSKIPYVGWIIGVPLIVAGVGMQATGKTMQVAAPAIGKAVKMTIKAGSRAAARGIKKGSKKVQKHWNRFKRKMVNRIKQIPAKIKNIPKNIKKKFLKSTRKMRARAKYRHQKRTGHGPANWKPSDGSGSGSGSNPNPKPSPKPRDRDKDKPNTGDSSGGRKDTFGRKVLRGALNAVDRADEKVDEALDSAENSFGNGGNQVLPDTNSDN